MKKIILLSIVAFFLFSNCKKDDPFVPTAPPSIDSTEVLQTYTYLALGDSYTTGHNIPRKENYPNQLVDSLGVKGINLDLQFNISTTGWTTDDLKRGIVNSDGLFGKTFDLVTLLIGVNNQYQGRSITEYEKEFEELLNTAMFYAGEDTSRVVVLSIPDYAYTPFGNGSTNISNDIDEFNMVNTSISANYNIKYINITDISRRGLEEPDLVASDGLHPSGKQYSLWVERLCAPVAELLIP